MQVELRVSELESELLVSLPGRNLMRRRRHHGGVHASYGSAANGNTTNQTNSNGQTVVNLGSLHSAGIKLSSHNTNNNSNTQTGTPINFGIA